MIQGALATLLLLLYLAAGAAAAALLALLAHDLLFRAERWCMTNVSHTYRLAYGRPVYGPPVYVSAPPDPPDPPDVGGDTAEYPSEAPTEEFWPGERRL